MPDRCAQIEEILYEVKVTVSSEPLFVASASRSVVASARGGGTERARSMPRYRPISVTQFPVSSVEMWSTPR